MKSDNPKCPYSQQDCYNFNEYIDCKTCSEYGNGVRATGSAPILHEIVEFFKRIYYAIKK